jgi:hypothetical protein
MIKRLQRFVSLAQHMRRQRHKPSRDAARRIVSVLIG